MSNNTKPVLAVTLGDATGIGPELVAKIAADGFLEEMSRPLILGDKRVLDLGKKIAGVDFPVHLVDSAANADYSKGINMIDIGDIDPATLTLGEVNPAAGKSAGDTIVFAMDLFKQGLVDAIVFAPFNKAALKKGGYKFESEHELFRNYFNVTTASGEINVMGDIVTSRVTSHIPLKEVSDHLNKENVLGAIRLLDETVKRTGVKKPRLAVAGLNPHNGDSGTCGREEIDVIAPAVEAARAEGIDATGPISADTLFNRAFDGDFDAVVTMFHDQGQIAIKLKGFDQGVTLAGGIPAPIATPAHGTAFDIVGKNLARPSATKHAIKVAIQMAKNKEVV